MISVVQKERLEAVIKSVIDIEERAKAEEASIAAYEKEAKAAFHQAVHAYERSQMLALRKERLALKRRAQKERAKALADIEKEKKAAIEQIERALLGDQEAFCRLLLERLFGGESRG